MTERHTLEVKYDSESGDHYLQFTPDMLSQVGWDFGDTLIWKDNEDGSFTLSKKVEESPSDPKGNAEPNGAAEK